MVNHLLRVGLPLTIVLRCAFSFSPRRIAWRWTRSASPGIGVAHFVHDHAGVLAERAAASRMSGAESGARGRDPAPGVVTGATPDDAHRTTDQATVNA
jgi:hypothetical protein